MSKKTDSPPVAKEKLIALYRKALVSGVPLNQVEETVEKQWERAQVSQNFDSEEETKYIQTLKKQLPLAVRLGAVALPLFFLAIGFYLVGSAVVPIAGYYVARLPKLQAGKLTAPIPHEDVLDVTPVVITQALADSGTGSSILGAKAEPKILDEALDYTNLNNWFASTGIPELSQQERASTEYIINIPKLEIENAVVTIGGVDLNKSLIAYPGTAMPGEFGSPVIFGHSVLRQFYNPHEKNPRRYNSIFSTIMTLQNGDEIFVEHEGVKYTYVVQDKTEVKPEDVYILAQKYDSKKLKLVTCTPEGTYLRRGVITAQLVTNSEGG